MDGEDAFDPFEQPGLHDVVRPARHHLFGGLEQQANATAETARSSERLGRTDQRSGVDVVTAGMAHAGHRGGERKARRLPQREGIYVGPESDHPVTATDIRHDAGSGRQ